jgi:hypothetical protein
MKLDKQNNRSKVQTQHPAGAGINFILSTNCL